VIQFGPMNLGKRAVLVAVVASLAPLSFGQTPGESQDPVVSSVDAPNTDVDDSAISNAVDGLPLYDLPSHGPLSIRLEYVCWWMNGNPLPPLVTTAPLGIPPVLGSPETRVLFGNEEVDTGARGGFRGTWNVRLAHWLETDLELAGHLIFLGHGQSSGDFFAESTGVPVLGRPFLDLQTSSQDFLPVAVPGLPFPDPVLGIPDTSVTLNLGQIEADSSSDLSAAGVLLRRHCVARGAFWCDLLAGYRYVRYQEGLTLRQSQFYRDPTNKKRFGEIHIEDSFSTWSEFHGVDLGIETHLPHRFLKLELLAKLAFGNVHQILGIRGNSLAIRPEDNDDTTPQVVEQGYGFLATPSRVGRYTANHFGVVPEFGVTLHWSAGRSFSITLGYTLLALPHVLRTGDQIDLAIVPFQAMAQTGVTLNESILLIQGINVGVEF
jgi:hypothetical protein